MDLSYQRRLASELMKVGKDRVYFDPDHLNEIKEAVSRENIRILINKGYIRKLQEKGTSRVRARYIKEQKKKGRRMGLGKRKGTKGARKDEKERWITQIRAIRKELRRLRDSEKISIRDYRLFYRWASAGRIKTKSYLHLLLSKYEKDKKAKEERLNNMRRRK